MGGVITRTSSTHTPPAALQSLTAIESGALLTPVPAAAAAVHPYAPSDAYPTTLQRYDSNNRPVASSTGGSWSVSRDVLVHVLSSFFVLEQSRDPNLLSGGYQLLQLCKWSSSERATMKQRMGRIERQSDWTVARGGRQAARSHMEVIRGPFFSRYTWWQPVESRVPESLFPLRWKVKYKVRVCDKPNGEAIPQPQIVAEMEAQHQHDDSDDDEEKDRAAAAAAAGFGAQKVSPDWSLSLDKDEVQQGQLDCKESATRVPIGEPQRLRSKPLLKS